MATQFNEQQVGQHRARLQDMETEYLLGAWQIGTEDEWTPEGLEAIRRILSDRLGSVPPRPEVGPLVSPSLPDTYHDHDAIIGWSFRLQSVSWLLLAASILSLLSLVPGVFGIISDVLFGQGYFGLEFGLPLLIPIASAAVSFGLFMLLRAGSQALLLLLEIEDNTRRSPTATLPQSPSVQAPH